MLLETIIKQTTETQEESLIHSYLINRSIIMGILGMCPNYIAKEMKVKGSPFDTYSYNFWVIFRSVRKELTRQIKTASKEGPIDYEIAPAIAQRIAVNQIKAARKELDTIELAYNTDEEGVSYTWVLHSTGKTTLLTFEEEK